MDSSIRSSGMLRYNIVRWALRFLFHQDQFALLLDLSIHRKAQKIHSRCQGSVMLITAFPSDDVFAA
ncbi:MAG: hypothetical protein Q8M98_04215, partial [Candidatus Cloacimonadaceae bacterium]|nr:hypothetical protein [Candidatus Cloacimonadaceae bacterium]